MYMHLLSSTYGHGATNIHSKAKRKATLKRRGWQTGSVDLYVAWSLVDGTSPTIPMLVTCTLVVRR